VKITDVRTCLVGNAWKNERQHQICLFKSGWERRDDAHGAHGAPKRRDGGPGAPDPPDAPDAVDGSPR
jgi:hypothetical protein